MKIDPILVGAVLLLAVVVVLVVLAVAARFAGEGGAAGGRPAPPCICPDCPGVPPGACASCTGGGGACGHERGCGSGEKCDPALLARGAEIAGCCVGAGAAPGAPDCCCKNRPWGRGSPFTPGPPR